MVGPVIYLPAGTAEPLVHVLAHGMSTEQAAIGAQKKKKKKKQPAMSLPSFASSSASGAKRKLDAATGSSSSAVKATAELDDIFSALPAAKQAKREREAVAARAADDAAKAEAKKAKAHVRRDIVRDPVFGEEYDPSCTINPQSARVHRFDNPSGLNVYKAHHLGLGKGGNTPQCPFDCWCCF